MGDMEASDLPTLVVVLLGVLALLRVAPHRLGAIGSQWGLGIDMTQATEP